MNHFGIRTPNIRFVVRGSEELQKITEKDTRAPTAIRAAAFVINVFQERV